MTSGEAREILNIEGHPINIRTFEKLIEAKLIRVDSVQNKTGTRLFSEEEILALVKYLPKKRSAPPYESIVNYIKKQLNKKR